MAEILDVTAKRGTKTFFDPEIRQHVARTRLAVLPTLKWTGFKNFIDTCLYECDASFSKPLRLGIAIYSFSYPIKYHRFLPGKYTTHKPAPAGRVFFVFFKKSDETEM
jgi:hypothetical protein